MWLTKLKKTLDYYSAHHIELFKSSFAKTCSDPFNPDMMAINYGTDYNQAPKSN